ncbi:MULTISPECIES: 50S ribosomal protein L11 methyltransferase [unclassified Alcanivorax]|jgi:ribosomal protein L11 methyltransferase|uniref:50S ribosomal protein L11 methyltransferase n=1 Tax=unclassified Alcanivorax TaxID=2638842 RepID=UPI00089FD6E3|nr:MULTISPECIES: 50S ribosomal protein L11 methyltransferase [unclassified Alcanivorax]MBB09377.1 50S ribosomal protein L11 methyltransferase [Alcanivorax sp.]MBU84041.1 50S ribosomal protein L11 methyltransferase [Alcanivorax sp.]MEE3388758.1 50S ribosomal protein L11 methyltransferase [Pseudomonadota bacterium]SEF95102.1 [LSU ribosomal protein L11P]-lysine N-methyltransferase [Alcanivorax sp. DSM 26293]
MAWLQLHLATTEAHADAFQSALEDMGACAVTLTDGADQPVFEPPPGARPLWQNTVVSALFDADRDPALILAALQQQGLEAQAHHHETLDDQVWERAWMDDFAPMRFGERLWIVPSWSASPDPQAVNLKLDPGLAFGTGTHETTALCLEWLDRADLTGKAVLDFGCGSGVLAIAALLLGAGNATGTDIDPQALTASEDNARNNGVADALRLYLPENLPADYRCDVLVANILAGPLVELAGQLASYCRPGGSLALSGILAEQAESVRNAYAPWFDLNPTTQQGDWVRIDGVRRKTE